MDSNHYVKCQRKSNVNEPVSLGSLEFSKTRYQTEPVDYACCSSEVGFQASQKIQRLSFVNVVGITVEQKKGIARKMSTLRVGFKSQRPSYFFFGSLTGRMVQLHVFYETDLTRLGAIPVGPASW